MKHFAKTTGAATLSASVLALVVASVGSASAAGGGPGGGGGGGAAGGGGAMPAPSIAGTWSGLFVNPAPVVSSQATLTVQQDAAGNLSAELCSSVTGQPNCGGPLTGQMRTNGQFQLRGENLLMSGMIGGTVVCADGSLGEMISGATQARGSTGTFGFNNCP